MKAFDLNGLIKWCRLLAVSAEINFYEGSDELEIKITSCAPTENYYQKRAISLEHFMDSYFKHTGIDRKIYENNKREPTKFDYLLGDDCGPGKGESIKIRKVGSFDET